MFITHRPTLTLQLHNFDLLRTCRTSSFCTVAWQLDRFQLTRLIAWSLGDSGASCQVVCGTGMYSNCVFDKISADIACLRTPSALKPVHVFQFGEVAL